MGLKRWLGRSDKDYQEEIRAHIAMETQANMDRGISAEESDRAARISFGSIAGTRQLLNEGRPGYWLSTVTQDVRYALRTMRRNVLLSCAVVLTLSIGIGFTTAVFSVVSAVAFNPPVSVDAASFVMILNKTKSGSETSISSVPEYLRLRTQVRSLRELAAWSGSFRLSAPLGSMDTRSVGGWLTSCNFFSVFSDEKPLLGRFFQEDDCSKASPVIVISAHVWRDRFAADPEIVGKSVSYGGHPLTVVGVALPPKLLDESAPGLWLPYTLQPSLKQLGSFPNRDWLGSESFSWLQMAGRLQPGYSREAAAAELKVLMGRGEADSSRHEAELRLTDGSIWAMFPDDMLLLFAIALSFPTMVMLIVCATVATLLLSRAVSRQREVAVRLALGADRRRLVQMLLVESVLLSLAAGIVGLVLVFQLPGVLLSLISLVNVPPVVVSPDWKVFCYMAVATALTAILSGLSPALESLNTRLVESLKGHELFGRRRGGSLTRHILVGVQVAFSMVLMVTAGTLLRAERQQADLGFETRQVVFAALPQSLALEGRGSQASLAAAVRSIPGVRSVAFSNSLPALFEEDVQLDVPGQSAQTFLSADVSPEYFRTLDIPILSGRAFGDSDRFHDAAEELVVVSQRFADRVFLRQNPVGQTLRVSKEDRRLRVIGVAKNRAASGTRQAKNDGSFVYQRMKPQSIVYLFARFDGQAAPFERTLQSSLKEETGSVLSVRTIQSRLDERMAILRRVEILLLATVVGALALALFGLYGVVSFNVTRGKKDFAIRAALGASRLSIFQAVVAAGMRPIPLGILAGIVLSFGALKIMDTQGFMPMGVASRDPLSYVVAGIVLVFAIFVALAVPAYRAMSSNPVHALREE